MPKESFNFESFKKPQMERGLESANDEGFINPEEGQRYKIVEGSNIGHGPTIVSANEDFAVEPDPNSYEVEESQFEVIPGTEKNQYGPSIRRQTENTILNLEDDVDDVAQSVIDNYEAVKSQLESYSLTEGSRMKLRAVLMALGVTVLPMKEMKDSLYNDSELVPVTTSWNAGKAPVIDNELVTSNNQKTLDVSAESKENIKAEIDALEEVALDYQRRVEAEKPTPKNNIEVNQKEREGEPLDAFEKEAVEHSKSLGQVNLDYIKEHAYKKVDGSEKYTRIEFVQKKIEFSDNLPPTMQEELRKKLPGLCVQESKFNDKLVSKSGARGVMQIMPVNWVSYGGKPEDALSLKKQVEIAGKLFSDYYEQLKDSLGDDSLQTLRNQFASEDSFQKDLMVPLLINSYNAGPSRVGEAARLFVKKMGRNNKLSGKELYLAIAKYAESSKEGKYLSGYGEESAEYVTKVYGFDERELHKVRKKKV